MRLHARNIVAIMLSLVVAVSLAQTVSILPSRVSADQSISVTLARATTSTEPANASASVEINPQSGRITIEIHQASPASTYLAFFASGGSTLQLGTFTTGTDGEATFQTTLSAGTYTGIIDILRNGLIQFVSASTSFTIGATASSSGTLSSNLSSSTITTTSATTSTLTGRTTSTLAAAQVQIHIEPQTRTINAGDYAKFSINIQVGGFASVLLAVKGTPLLSHAIFTQESGLAAPAFHSDLTVVTSENTPTGNYAITVVSLLNGQQYDAQLTMVVQGSSTTTSSQTSNQTGLNLQVTANTDQLQYNPGGAVNVQGNVVDEEGNAVNDAGVSLQVDGPTGTQIVFVTNLKTNGAGVFRFNFTLSSNATAGTYTAFVLASQAGYTGAATHTTFVVGISATPSVVIKEVYTTDIAGNRSTVFSAGQTVLVWVVIQNSGATFQGVVWLQVHDSNGTPVWIQFQISQLGTGQTVSIAFGFQLTAGVPSGLYTSNALVSDKLISQGGSFFASSSAEFDLAS